MRALPILAAAVLATGCPPGIPQLPEPYPDAAAPTSDGRGPGAAPARDAAPAREVGGARDSGGAADTRADEAPERPGSQPAPDAAEPDVGRDAAAEEAGPDAAADLGIDLPPPARSPRPGDVAIAEILIDPAGNDLGHEWVELVGLADDPVDLAGLHVADGVTDVAVDAGLLPAHGILVLGQSTDPAHNGGAPVDRGYGTRLQLNNDADRLALCLGACADGLLLDVFAWQAPLGADYQGRAVVIDPVTKETCAATGVFGDGTSYGSPGTPNPPCSATHTATSFAP